jgi:Rad3-related DNA helicase
MRSGDIRSGKGGVADEKAMEAGSRIHKKIQRAMPISYRAEVTLKTEIKREHYTIGLEGRADGIDERKDRVTIDEIKGIYRDLALLEEPFSVHQAQAMCYAYLYLLEHETLETIQVQMTYCNLETEEIKRFETEYERSFLEEWFYELIDGFCLFADLLYEFQKERQESIPSLAFPFSYRKGQKEMTASVYYAIREEKNLFIQAPTGVGKTMSTLFPAVKALGEERIGKIFYLTARTITRTVAQESLSLLLRQGLKMRFVTITARDKLCVCEKRECHPKSCPRAEGHYDRVNQALYELLRAERKMDRETILDYAECFQVCPYELCLDASLFSEAVICDYNYVFDPTVRLKRYFQGSRGDYLFLVDETHNLVERARQMYSATLYKEDILACRKFMNRWDKKIHRQLGEVNQKMLDLKKQCSGLTLLDDVASLCRSLDRLKAELDRFFELEIEFPEKDTLLELYFQVMQFLNTYEELDNCYKIYGEENGKSFYVKLFCIQPCKNLAQCLDYSVSTIFFSATILPVEYYKQVLCGNKEEYAVYIPSPFAEEKRFLAVGGDVSSRYSRRSYGEYYKIYEYLIGVLTAKEGNYIVFFPSYQMMGEVLSIFYEEGYPSRYRVLVQDIEMREEEKESFLKEFEQGPVLGFCVLGGAFSEGIDLSGEKLIGVVLVGTGLPMVCGERELLKSYYEEQGEDGFAYAYLYPGMNKVLQAAGRVIRTATDEGVILLLDDRFLQKGYQDLFPREWSRYHVVNRANVKPTLQQFWKEREEDEI